MALRGATFCIAGALSRENLIIEILLRDNGAGMTSTITPGTTHVICNDTATNASQVQRAKSLNLSIVDEATFMAMVGVVEPSTVSKAPQPPPSQSTSPQGKDVIHIPEKGHTKKDATKKAGTVPKKPVAQPAVAQGRLKDGEARCVPGKSYVMKNVGGVYSCSCPAWRFQSKSIDVRTCKHLRELRGEESEAARTGSSSATPRKRLPGTAADGELKSNKAQKLSSDIQPGGLFQSSNLMLAHSWKSDKSYTLSDFLISEKLDGMRALWDGKQLVSRAGNKIHAPDFFTAGFPPSMALDGELFSGRGQFQQTVSIARRMNGGEAWRSLRFVVFDAPSHKGGFEDRLAAVFALESEFVVVHPHESCRDQQHLEAELKRVEGLGGEGLMLRRKQSAYRQGRSNDLLKVKTFKDEEAYVHGHQAGKGKHKGRMGALLCRLKNGVEFKVGTGFSDEQRDNPPPIGSVVTFRYFEMTQAGVPRFPSYLRLRPDVEASLFAS